MQPTDFQILGNVHSIEIIAVGRGVRKGRELQKTYGGSRWRKLKGIALIEDYYDGEIYEAEIHWYEAHGVGRRGWKIKRRLS